jgi:hypothetical protein
MHSEVTHEVELNFYYLHYNDARKLAEAAEREETKLRSMYARHSILAVVFAGEALANRLLDDYSQLPSRAKHLQRLGIREKWIIAPFVCGRQEPLGRTFEPGLQPFQQFSELVAIRNWLAHPEVKRFLGASADGSTITIMETGEEVPWVDTQEGPVWPQTKIPINPFELTATHAKTAIRVLDAMVQELKSLHPELVTDKWLEKVLLRHKETGEEEEITTDSLFGGYTPSQDEAW